MEKSKQTAESEIAAITEALVPPAEDAGQAMTAKQAEESILTGMWAGQYSIPNTATQTQEQIADQANPQQLGWDAGRLALQDQLAIAQQLKYAQSKRLTESVQSQIIGGFAEQKQVTPAVPTIGKVVHFYDTWKPGAVRAAIVVGVTDNLVDLVVFDPTQNPVAVLYTQIPFDERSEKKVGTCAWPERV